MIGTLTSSSSSSSTKIILEDFPAGIFRCGTEIFRSLPRKKLHYNKLLRLDSAQKNRILKSIPLRSSSIEVSQVNLETEEIEAVNNSPTKTVRVRFQLRKECVFGEHFFILGDDPVFGGGLWDPENALPLNWSDGHVWTIDLDLPVGRLVEFKFILKAMTGEILWQPGRNRSIETWETKKTIRVCEDWENADLQMMIEEDYVPVKQEEQQYNMPIVEEDEVLGGTTAQQESLVENVGYISDDSEENSSFDIESEKHILTAVTKEAMFNEEEVPVLVPGLFPMSDLEDEEESDDEHITDVTEEVINEGKAESFLEVDNEKERNEKAISIFDRSKLEAVNSVETEPLETPNVVLENDIEWGRRTLYKLLSNFGLF